MAGATRSTKLVARLPSRAAPGSLNRCRLTVPARAPSRRSGSCQAQCAGSADAWGRCRGPVPHDLAERVHVRRAGHEYDHQPLHALRRGPGRRLANARTLPPGIQVGIDAPGIISPPRMLHDRVVRFRSNAGPDIGGRQSPCADKTRVSAPEAGGQADTQRTSSLPNRRSFNREQRIVVDESGRGRRDRRIANGAPSGYSAFSYRCL